VRHCHDFEACAYQDRKYTLVGPGGFQPMSENCLTLNVVAPENQDGPLPVMFFIHGGGYLLGSSATVIYDGGAIAKRGCVYVSANYRLGALGCVDLSSLSTAEDPIDANLFLRDLTLALKWVRDNIAGFGGDPDNVTIFGESAGAHAVATLVAVPEAKGLFHQAISESPPSGMVQSADTAADVAERLADALGADPTNAAQTVKTSTPWQLVKSLERVMMSVLSETPGNFGIGPSVDGQYLPQGPVEAMASGRAHPVPLIIGNNADEGKLFARLMDHLPTNRTKIDQLLADAEPAARERIMRAYPDYPSLKACLQLGGDYAFGSMAWQIAEAHAPHAPTFLYRYDYAPRALDWVGLGATHATELFAVFDVYRTKFGGLLTVAGDRRSARRVSDTVQRHWDAFAHNGAPDGDWPAYAGSDRAVMIFDKRSRVEYDPDPTRRKAWQDFSVA
jgi:para-nitrobenzyl esterase